MCFKLAFEIGCQILHNVMYFESTRFSTVRNYENAFEANLNDLNNDNDNDNRHRHHYHHHHHRHHNHYTSTKRAVKTVPYRLCDNREKQ